jgi:hypothetical protein
MLREGRCRIVGAGRYGLCGYVMFGRSGEYWSVRHWAGAVSRGQSFGNERGSDVWRRCGESLRVVPSCREMCWRVMSGRSVWSGGGLARWVG